MVKIYLGGFPLEANELELVQLVSPYCTVVTIKIVRDKKTRVCKGYAFLEVENKEGADAAIEALDGADYKGRDLKLAIVPDAPPKPAYRPQNRYQSNDRPAYGDRRPSGGGDRKPYGGDRQSYGNNERQGYGSGERQSYGNSGGEERQSYGNTRPPSTDRPPFGDEKKKRPRKF